MEENLMAAPTSPHPQFLSRQDCQDLLQRIAKVVRGGGYTTIGIHSEWHGSTRWGRNTLTGTAEVQSNWVSVTRNINGAANFGLAVINDLSDAGLLAAVWRAEEVAGRNPEAPMNDLAARYHLEPFTELQLFSEATAQLNYTRRADVAVSLMHSAVQAEMLSAGYIEVSAHSLAQLDTLGHLWYFPYTQAQYSVTVRDPQGTGSGWAGMDWYDWTKIDGEGLSKLALEKCLQSRHPVAIEPGRYTTILEPQAVGDFVYALTEAFGDNTNPIDPFYNKLHTRVIDARLSLRSDPMDPTMGFPPFHLWEDASQLKFSDPVFHPTTWINQGVLAQLSYSRGDGLGKRHERTGLGNPYAFRMESTGQTVSVEEMIATTTRGLLVTRFDRLKLLDRKSILQRGNTRDGLWLIEGGKITKAVKNLTFTESVLFALNNVEQIGIPQRLFHPPLPVFVQQPTPLVIPALKVQDFSFTALDDAV